MIEIACCTDCNYVMQTSVMILSACTQNANEKITFHVVTDGSVADKDKARMEKVIAPFAGKKMFSIRLCRSKRRASDFRSLN